MSNPSNNPQNDTGADWTSIIDQVLESGDVFLRFGDFEDSILLAGDRYDVEIRNGQLQITRKGYEYRMCGLTEAQQARFNERIEAKRKEVSANE